MTDITADGVATRPPFDPRRFLRRHGWTIGVYLLLLALVLYWRTTTAAPWGPFDVQSVSIDADDLRVTIAITAEHSVAGQEIGVRADFSLASGWHIYGRPLPSNYTATSIEFEADGVASQAFEFPTPEQVRFEMLGETLPVYHGDFRAKGALLLRSGLKPGDFALKGKLKFQECSAEVCKIPQTIAFELPIRIDAMAPSAPK